MVADLRLRGMMGRRGLMFVSYYGKSRAFISNYRSWREYDSVGKTAEVEQLRREIAIVEEYLPKKASAEETERLVEAFLAAEYGQAERYLRRLGKIAALEGEATKK